MGSLFERCTLCNGSRAGKGGSPCMGCSGDGFIAIGLTMKQVDRLVEAERRRMGDPAVAGPGRESMIASILMSLPRVSRELLDEQSTETIRGIMVVLLDDALVREGERLRAERN